jgi:hypothetical protein
MQKAPDVRETGVSNLFLAVQRPSCVRLHELCGLGLSPEEEADIVSYLKAFTDNYPLWGNRHGKRDRNVPPGTPSPFLE